MVNSQFVKKEVKKIGSVMGKPVFIGKSPKVKPTSAKKSSAKKSSSSK